MLEPVSVGLKFAFVAVLYLFLAWVVRSMLKDLRRDASSRRGAGAEPGLGQEDQQPEVTSLHQVARDAGAEAVLVVERAPGHDPGMSYEIGAGAVLGRGDRAEIRLEDPFASSRHAQLSRQGGVVVLEDLGSTNGTYLNEELVEGPQPLHVGDRVRIGDSEFSYREEAPR